MAPSTLVDYVAYVAPVTSWQKAIDDTPRCTLSEYVFQVTQSRIVSHHLFVREHLYPWHSVLVWPMSPMPRSNLAAHASKEATEMSSRHSGKVFTNANPLKLVAYATKNEGFVIHPFSTVGAQIITRMVRTKTTSSPSSPPDRRLVSPSVHLHTIHAVPPVQYHSRHNGRTQLESVRICEAHHRLEMPSLQVCKTVAYATDFIPHTGCIQGQRYRPNEQKCNVFDRCHALRSDRLVYLLP